MIRHEGRFPARLANDLRAFYEGADNLWWPVGLAGGSQGITGNIPVGQTLGPSSLSCRDDCQIDIGGYIIGAARTGFEGVADSLDTHSLGLPRWNGSNFYDQIGDITGYTSTANGATTNCASPCTSSFTAGQLFVEDRLLEYNPNVSVGTPQSAGVAPPSMNPLTYPSTGGSFALQGTPFGIGDLLKRMKGLKATCVEARMEVKFDGLEVDEWSFVSTQPRAAIVGGSVADPDLAATSVGIVNGVTVVDYARSGDGTVTKNVTASPGAASTSGSANFVLMGRKPRSASIIDINNNPQSIELPEFDTLGASVSVSATSGSYATMSATALINALLGYKGDASQFFLFPSIGNPLPGDLAGLRAYLGSLRATETLTSATRVSDTAYSVSFSVSGRNVTFDSLTIGVILARFRLPSGILETVRRPLLIDPPREPAP